MRETIKILKNMKEISEDSINCGLIYYGRTHLEDEVTDIVNKIIKISTALLE